MQDGSLQVQTSEQKAADIAESRLLAALPATDQARLAPHLIERTFQAGELVQETGRPWQQIYFPVSGTISLLAVLPGGNAIYTAMIGCEGALGLSAGLGSRRAVGRAIAHSPVCSLSIAEDRFADVAAASAAVRAMIARYNDLLLAQVQQTALCNTFHHLQSRVCRWLLHARDGMPSDTIALTQQYLSGVLGARRTSINMVVGTLQAEGIVEVRRGRIMIRDLERLKGKACSCYDAVRHLTGTAAGDDVTLQPRGPAEHARQAV